MKRFVVATTLLSCSAGQASACSMLNAIPPWIFGMTYISIGLAGLIAFTIFRIKAISWIILAFALTAVMDVATYSLPRGELGIWLAADPSPGCH
jgi:hypothetical protein